MEKPKHTIYFDGSCDLCKVAVDVIDTSSGTPPVSYKDASKGETPEGVSQRQVMSAVYVVDDQGNTYVGLDGVIQILSTMPSWKWLGRLLALPVFYSVGKLLYWIVSSTRHVLPWGILLRNKKSEPKA